MDEMATVIGILLAVLMVLVFLSLAVYILHSIALYRAFRYCGYDMPWLAWIPVARDYALADCVTHGMETVYVWSCNVPGMVFRCYWALCGILWFVPYVGLLLSTVLKVFIEGPCYAYLYGVIGDRDPRDEMAIGCVSSLVWLVPIIKFWRL